MRAQKIWIFIYASFELIIISMQIFDFWKSETYVYIAEESTKKRFDKKYDKGPKFGSKQTSQSKRKL